MIDVDAARRYLSEMLPAVEIEDPDILDAAAAVVIGSRRSESPRVTTPRATAATTTERILDESYRPEETATS